MGTPSMGSQRVRILIRAIEHIIMMLEMLNALQREPQMADLNIRRELISHSPRPIFICCVGACGFITRRSALIAWHNAFKAQPSML